MSQMLTITVKYALIDGSFQNRQNLSICRYISILP